MMLAQTSWRWRWNLWWCKVGRHQQQKTRIKVSWGRPWGLEMQNWEEMYWFKMHARHKKWKLCDDNSSAWRQPARHQAPSVTIAMEKTSTILWCRRKGVFYGKTMTSSSCPRPWWTAPGTWCSKVTIGVQDQWTEVGAGVEKNLLRWSGKWRTLPARKA